MSELHTRYAPLFSWLAVALLALFLNQWYGVCHDTSWYLDVIERMQAGEQLYVDVIEVNPPFSVWLYWLPGILGESLSVRSEMLVLILVYLFSISCIFFSSWLLVQSKLHLWCFTKGLPILALIFLVLPASTLTQREHLGAVGMLPFIVLQYIRVMRAASPPWWALILGGLCGSVMVLAKPYYGFCYFSLFCYVFWKTRDPSLWRATEYWTICVLCICYLLVVTLVYPTYFSNVWPTLKDSYLAYRRPWGELLEKAGSMLLFCSALYLLLTRSFHRNAMSELFWLASVSMVPVYVYMGKGFIYHLYPLSALMACTLLCVWQSRNVAEKPTTGRQRFMLGMLIVIGWSALFLPFFKPHAAPTSLVQLLKVNGKRPVVEFVGEGLHYGHPLNRAIDGRIISPYYSDWLPHYLALNREDAGSGSDTGHRESLQQSIDSYYQAKFDRCEKVRPDIYFIAGNEKLVRSVLGSRGFADAIAQGTYYEMNLHYDGLFLLIEENYLARMSDAQQSELSPAHGAVARQNSELPMAGTTR